MTILFKTTHDDEFREVEGIFFKDDNETDSYLRDYSFQWIKGDTKEIIIVYYPDKQQVYCEIGINDHIYVKSVSHVTKMDIIKKIR
jgi:hypothetical protein